MSKAELITFRVERGALVPANESARKLLRAKNLVRGDMIMIPERYFQKRNYEFHKKAHAIGKMLVESIDDFKGLDPHSAIKRVQRLGLIECEETTVVIPGMGEVTMVKPKSIAFSEMGQRRFYALVLNLCRFVAERYFPTMSAEDVLKLSESFVDE